MAINSVRTALQLLSGAGELTRAKALEAAATLLELPGVGDTSVRAGQLAEELLQAAAANQQLVHDLVSAEFERQLGRLGLVRGSDLEAAQRRIAVLEAEVAVLRDGASHRRGEHAEAAPPRASRTAVKRSAAKRSAAAKTAAAKTAAATTAAREATATPKTTTRKTATPTTAAREATATPNTPTPKTTTRKAATRKAATRKTGVVQPTARTQTSRGTEK
jgi:hypothetical protein